MSKGDELDWTWVYVLSAVKDGLPVKPTKVGISRSYKTRFGAIRTSSPLEVAGVVALPLPSRSLAYAVEQTFHEMMLEKRLHGEWFDLCPIAAVIAVCTIIHDAFHEVGLPENQVYETLGRLGITRAMKVCLTQYGADHGENPLH